MEDMYATHPYSDATLSEEFRPCVERNVGEKYMRLEGKKRIGSDTVYNTRLAMASN
jgi:hypothetical protein